MNNLYQIFDKEFNDEKFCITAKNIVEAEKKMFNWIQYHSLSHMDFTVSKVEAPKYTDNVHNEWIR